MSWSINHAFKGLNGEFEVVRLLGAAGVAAYIIGANGFQAWNIGNGHSFDVAAYCIAFPGGLAAVLAAVAGSAAWKDKGVASAKVTAQTGAIPTPALDGARVPTGDPPPVQP